MNNLENHTTSLELSKRLKELEWKPITNFEGYYIISNEGHIISIPRKNGLGSRKIARLRKQKISRFGYSTIPLCKDGDMFHFMVHRLVADVFIPNPKNFPQVNHINGNKIDNRVENLEWCDHSYNQQHARRLGLMGGEKQNTSKLTERDVRAIRMLYPQVTKKKLSEAFDISLNVICQILSFKTWKNVKPK